MGHEAKLVAQQEKIILGKISHSESGRMPYFGTCLVPVWGIDSSQDFLLRCPSHFEEESGNDGELDHVVYVPYIYTKTWSGQASTII